MAHAGTMVGGSAQTKQSGSPWAAIALAVAVVVATIAGVWLASSAGLVGGTAKPAADRSYDQIEAQRGAITLSGDPARPMTSGSMASSTGRMQRRTSTRGHADERRQPGPEREVQRLFDRAHAAPYVGAAVTPPFSATSGTFHPGKPADQVMAPAKRDRVGGP